MIVRSNGNWLARATKTTKHWRSLPNIWSGQQGPQGPGGWHISGPACWKRLVEGKFEAPQWVLHSMVARVHRARTTKGLCTKGAMEVRPNAPSRGLVMEAKWPFMAQV